MEKKVFIEGMTCNHCKMRVEKALQGIEGVTKATVDLEQKVAFVESSNLLADEKIIKTVDDAGYQVKQIK